MSVKNLIVFEEEVDSELRKAAGLAFGLKKGNLSRAVNDSVRLWLLLTKNGKRSYDVVSDLANPELGLT